VQPGAGHRGRQSAGDIYLEECPDVNRYTLAFDRLVAAALHPDESVQLIEHVATSLT
jgi:hypothetical protein